MHVELWEFVKAIAWHWTALLTGSIVVAFMWGYEHYKGESIAWRPAFWIMVAAVFVSSFLAWREQYQGGIAERSYRSRVGDAPLRTAGLTTEEGRASPTSDDPRSSSSRPPSRM
jgi:hypothetical protein